MKTGHLCYPHVPHNGNGFSLTLHYSAHVIKYLRKYLSNEQHVVDSYFVEVYNSMSLVLGPKHTLNKYVNVDNSRYAPSVVSILNYYVNFTYKRHQKSHWQKHKLLKCHNHQSQYCSQITNSERVAKHLIFETFV